MARRKSWTALFYIVAKNLDDSGDGRYINSKAAEVAERVREAAHGFPDDMYVAFQVVFDPEEDGRPWFAELLNADDKEPTTHVGNFANPGPFSGDTLTEDLLGFYAWALPRCPADHVAVFFWGHSAGPAGLFAPALGIVVPDPPPTPPGTHPRKTAPLPSLNTPEIRDVLRKIRVGLTLRAADRPIEEIADLILKAKIEDFISDPSGAPLKVDVVLFQDCWMSTLETAFQLKDAVHFAIGSQSLVPFGKPAVPNDCDIEPSKEGNRRLAPMAKSLTIWQPTIPTTLERA